MFLSSMVVNYVTVMGERKVQLLVISDKYEEIRKELLTDMDLGVTLVHVETGYMRQEQMAVLCVTTARKLYGAESGDPDDRCPEPSSALRTSAKSGAGALPSNESISK